MNLSRASQFYKHRGGELEFSQILNGVVTTSYLRLGERTETAQPDGKTAFVLSSRVGDAWVTTDDDGTFEVKRWLDGDTLVMVRGLQLQRARMPFRSHFLCRPRRLSRMTSPWLCASAFPSALAARTSLGL